MADQDRRTYKLIELVGTSPTSYAEATKNAVERASETLRGLGWFEVTELRGLLENGAIVRVSSDPENWLPRVGRRPSVTRRSRVIP
jgi:dodecin